MHSPIPRHAHVSLAATMQAVCVPQQCRSSHHGWPRTVSSTYSTLGFALLRLFAREQFSTAPYEDKKLPFSKEPSFLPADFPPARRSPRPRLGPHPIPQRQLD